MDKPVVHRETWALVRQLSERWREPEWKVMHLAVVLLHQTAERRPEVVDTLQSITGDLGAGRVTDASEPGGEGDSRSN